MKHKPTKIKKAYLIASLAVLILGFFLTLFLANVEAAEFEEEQRNAMERMERAEAYIKNRILKKGIEIEETDLNKTGLLGPEFTELTSTPGEEGAKRSTLNPEFSAVMVRYFHEAGLEEGDTIAIGGSNVPVVITTATTHDGKLRTDADTYRDDQRPDFIYCGSHLPATLDHTQRYLVDFNAWDGTPATYPVFPYNAMPFLAACKAEAKFLVLPYGTPAEEYAACLRRHPEVVVVSMSTHQNRIGEQRALLHEMMNAGLYNPVVFAQMYRHTTRHKGDFMLEAAADMGALMIDGLTDGLWLMNDGDITCADVASTAYAILQAARLRTSKTEYISCPGCGRTLYDLRATIARIKAATAHMKGLKIGIMG